MRGNPWKKNTLNARILLYQGFLKDGEKITLHIWQFSWDIRNMSLQTEIP